MPLRTLYFIGHCLSLDDHPSFRETIIAQFSDEDYNWQNFIFTCSNHLVLPVIYLKFKAHDLLGYLPEVLVQHLEEIYSLNRDRNLQIIGQLKAITATLNHAGISPLFMKGTGNLIDGVYSDVGERIIGDIDFLVPEKDYLTAAGLFEKEGYEICFPSDVHPDKMKHYPRLWKKDIVADIEIHRLPLDIEQAVNFGADLVLKAKKTVVGYPGCYVLSDDHKVIHSFIHSQLTHNGHALGAISLRDIYDLYCFSKRINIQSITYTTPYRQKCIAYFKISEKLLMLPDKFYPGETISSRAYQFKNDLFSSSHIINKVNLFRFIFFRATGSAIQRIFDSLFDSTLRRKNMRKLFTSESYRKKFGIYVKMINGEK